MLIGCAVIDPRLQSVDDDLGEWDGSYGGTGFRRSDDGPAFDLRRGLAHIEAARLEVDVADAQADEFGPAQPGEGQDRQDVAVVTACSRQGGDFAGREIAVAFSGRYPSG